MKTPGAYFIDTVLSVVLLLTLLLHYGDAFGDADEYALIAVAIAGLVPVLWGAYRSIREREWASMDLLASIALVFSLLSREWVSAVFIELMLGAARILDDVTRDRTEKSIRGLLRLRPEITRVEHDGKLIVTPVQDIKPGNVVVADIEDRIPVDGIVISGEAAVDESSLTGESLPVEKVPGSRVLSSTLVQSGSLRIQTTHVGKDTTLERVIRLVESAREEKPDTQTLGEKFGKVYLISIFAGSALLYFTTQNIPLVLAVVLVVCADDVAVAIPIAYLRAIRAAAGIGVIVKGGKHLEALGQIQTLVLDKTGTLTTGTLAVTEVVVESGYSEMEVLETAMLADIRSRHPLSKAVVAYARHKGAPDVFPDSAEERGGRGVIATKGGDTIVVGRHVFLQESGAHISPELLSAARAVSAQGKAISFIAKNGRAIGFAAAADTIKDNAHKALSDLRALGVRKIIMLTGDNKQAAEAVAQKLGIDEWHADLFPENKVEIIKRLQAERLVAMVGDGVNDAAALSIARVGIAMGGLGTEGTIESAQIVLMRDDLSTLPATIRIAHMARNVSVQDFWIWGITNAMGLGLVLGGIIGPSGAAAYNFLSDFLPLANSIRVKVTKNA